MAILFLSLIAFLVAIGSYSFKNHRSCQVSKFCQRIPKQLLPLYMSKSDREKKKKKASEILKDKQKASTAKSLANPDTASPLRVSAQVINTIMIWIRPNNKLTVVFYRPMYVLEWGESSGECLSVFKYNGRKHINV